MLVVLWGGLGLLGSVAFGDGCPNEVVRGGASAGLPDCRVYELVTPAEKNSGRVVFTGVGGDEGTLTFTSLAGFGGPVSGEGFPGFVYVAGRDSEGWVTSSVVPSAARFIDLEADRGGTAKAGPAVGQSLDRRSTLWVLHEIGQLADSAGFYLSGLGGSVVEVGPAVPPGAAPVVHESRAASTPTGFAVQGVSADASRVVFHMGEAGSEWSFGQPGVGGPAALLEYIGIDNLAPIAVGVEDDGSPVDGCSSQLLGGRLEEQKEGERWTHNAISLDGKTIFLTDTCHFGIYARVDNGEVGAHTVAISEPSKEDCSACDTFEGELGKRSPAYFVGASSDGSKVFFTTAQPLLGGEPGETAENIYEYDFAAPAGERIVRVSGGDGTVSAPVANVQGVMQVAENGSRVYFVATGVLTAKPNGFGQVASAGSDNLYVFDTETGTTAFVTTLAPNDSELWGHSGFTFPLSSDLTADGRFLVFASHADLTPDDTSTATQIFEYDAQTGALVRVSKGEKGYNENGNTQLGSTRPVERDIGLEDRDDALLPEGGEYDNTYSASTYYDGLAVSADGSYVFFESSDGLTPQALNHVQIHPIGAELVELELGPFYAENVYEYHDGNVYLISDGRDVSSGLVNPLVSLLGSDPSGRDVFFTTTDELASGDSDTQLDIYDARVDGGFSGGGSPVECVADACQGALSGAPVLLSPGSEFQAGGNPPLAGSSVSPVKVKKKVVKASKRKKRAGKKKAEAEEGMVVRRRVVLLGGLVVGGVVGDGWVAWVVVWCVWFCVCVVWLVWCGLGCGSWACVVGVV